jgi:hypothetical protein
MSKYDDDLSRYLVSLEKRIEALERASARPRGLSRDEGINPNVGIDQSSGEQALND